MVHVCINHLVTREKCIMDHDLGGPPNRDDSSLWMEIWFEDLFRNFAFMQLLDWVCDCYKNSIFNPSQDSIQELLSNLTLLRRFFSCLGAVSVAPPLGHVVPMFRVFVFCLLPPNVGRLTVVLQRVQILTN
ncbi:hypothetical protein TNCT_191561 [Trichonephila clavata]|uniref:Uncharacterized protein n=1 Tax=Trichonephila clavata TaxID=2740835 RepID=A0A8X6LAZ6_TRICU|nr:hypothetical protein TNCT_191561 [Trichonephila clavata]